MPFPAACPEVPVSQLAAALQYYRDKLGFSVDWSDEALGLAGLSQGDCRLFMASTDYRTGLGNRGPTVLWVNFTSRGDVDTLFEQWRRAGAKTSTRPEAKPYKLYEFLAEDLDGNILRVFYDFAWEERGEAGASQA